MSASLALCLLMAIGVSASAETARRPAIQASPPRKIPRIHLDDRILNAETGVAVTVFRPDYVASPASPEEMAGQYLRERGEILGLQSPDLANLHEYATVLGIGSTTVRFRQSVAGLPVLDSDVAVTVNNRNEVSFVVSSYEPRIATPENLEPSLSETQARERVRTALGVSGTLRVDRGELYVAYLDGRSRLVYLVSIAAQSPRGAWQVVCDAETGEILEVRDRLLHQQPTTGQARVFLPDPLTTSKQRYDATGASGYGDRDDLGVEDADSAALTNELVEKTIDITQLGSLYYLKGTYAQVLDWDDPIEPLYHDFEQGTNDFRYTRGHARFEAVNAYYHLHEFMKYVNETLGIELYPKPFCNSRCPVEFDPHGVNGDDDSYYQGLTGRLSFGEGGVDDAEDADVVIHELGHGLHDWITGGNLSNRDGLSEGVGDYFAQSFSRYLNWTQPFWRPSDPQFNWVFNWDSFNEYSSPPNTGRVTNYAGVYPRDLKEEVHVDGQIWSSCNMRIWDAFSLADTEEGRQKTDRLMLEGLRMTSSITTQWEAARAVVQAARDLDYSDADIATIEREYTRCGYDLATEITHVEGSVWYDDDGDGDHPELTDLCVGVPTPGRPECYFASHTVYIDVNNNNNLDEGEPFGETTLTPPGTYDIEAIDCTFFQVPTCVPMRGTYTLRHQDFDLPLDFGYTTPVDASFGAGARRIDLGSSSSLTDMSFGLKGGTPITGFVWYSTNPNPGQPPSGALPLCPDKNVVPISRWTDCKMAGIEVFLDYDGDGWRDLNNESPLPRVDPSDLSGAQGYRVVAISPPADSFPLRIFALPPNEPPLKVVYPADGMHQVDAASGGSDLHFGIHCPDGCVVPPWKVSEERINDDATLYHFDNVPQRKNKNHDITRIDTGIPMSRQVCGVVGAQVDNTMLDFANLDESDALVLGMFPPLNPGPSPNWELRVHLADVCNALDGSCNGGSWDVDVLCLSTEVASYRSQDPRKVFFVQDYWLADNPGNTGVSAANYVCGTFGYQATTARFDTGNTPAILRADASVVDGTWRLGADIASTGPHERWYLSMLCASRDFAEQQNTGVPARIRPLVSFYQYRNLPTGGSGASQPTSYALDRWGCGIAGLAARNGDLDEDAEYQRFLKFRNEVIVFNQYHVRADVLTETGQGDFETWDLLQMCLSRETQNFNRTPVISVHDSWQLVPGVLNSFEIAAGDADGHQIVSWQVDGMPEGADWGLHPQGPNARRFVWTPRLEDVGHYDLVITVTDSRGGTAQAEVKVDVLPNHPPTIEVPEAAAFAGRFYHIRIRGMDEDNHPLTLTMSGAPAGAQLLPLPDLPSLWQFQYTVPESGYPPAYWVTFTLSDGLVSASRTVRIPVIADHTSPGIFMTTPLPEGPLPPAFDGVVSTRTLYRKDVTQIRWWLAPQGAARAQADPAYCHTGPPDATAVLECKFRVRRDANAPPQTAQDRVTVWIEGEVAGDDPVQDSFDLYFTVAAMPTIVPAGGVSSSPVSVSLSSATPGSQIYYTTNGTVPVPGQNGTRYTVPFTLSASATLKAITVRSGWQTSAMAEARFIIGPVVQLSGVSQNGIVQLGWINRAQNATTIYRRKNTGSLRIAFPTRRSSAAGWTPLGVVVGPGQSERLKMTADKFCQEKGQAEAHSFLERFAGGQITFWNGARWSVVDNANNSFIQDLTCATRNGSFVEPRRDTGGNSFQGSTQTYRIGTIPGAASLSATMAQYCQDAGFSTVGSFRSHNGSGVVAYWTGTQWSVTGTGFVEYVDELQCSNPSQALVILPAGVARYDDRAVTSTFSYSYRASAEFGGTRYFSNEVAITVR